jgi:hypothetical protein
MKNSPYGPEIVTLSPGFLENIYDEHIPGFTASYPSHCLLPSAPTLNLNGGVAILIVKDTILPSAG